MFRSLNSMKEFESLKWCWDSTNLFVIVDCVCGFMWLWLIIISSSDFNYLCNYIFEKMYSFCCRHTSNHSATSHCGPQVGLLQSRRSGGRSSSPSVHRSLYTELSRPGASIFQHRTKRNWNPSPHVREHSLQLLASHLWTWPKDITSVITVWN